MSGHNDGYVVGIEMVDLEMGEDPDPDDYPTEENNAEDLRSPYKNKFRSILTKCYTDQMTWWAAVEDLLKRDSDFAEKATAKTQAEGVESRKQAIVEVMVDLLLDMEGITMHQGLVYVLDELESYPLELMAIELLRRGADPNREKGSGGSTPLHLAITGEKVDLVKKLLKKDACLETKDDYGYTPLLTAVKNDTSGNIIDLLLERGANVCAVTEDRKTALHFAARKDMEKTMKQMIKRGLPVNAEDKVGWTSLHEAARYGSKGAAAVLIGKGASVNTRDHRKRTPLHVAAEEGEKELIKFLLSKKADANITDLDGNAPVDLAAKKQKDEAVEFLLKHSPPSKKDKAVKKDLEKAMDQGTDIKDGLVEEKIGEISSSGVIRMFKPTTCGGEGKFKLIKHFVKQKELKKSTKAILDQFVVGKSRRGQVICEILDADKNGIPPDHEDFKENTQSLLDVIVENNDKELAQHPSIMAMMDHKWKAFARWLFLLSFMLYAVRMLFFGLALLIAARPDLDNPGCYRDGWDYFRGVCEGISILFFLFKLVDEIQEMFSLWKYYFKDQYNFLQVLTVILPLLIIPFRAATTWCASTGDGYCVDPTLLPNAANANNFTLDINQACITASSVQWIIASLAYMVNAILVLEYLSLSRQLGVYVRTLKEIVVKDMLKFTVLFIVALYIFVGSFYLALRAGVMVNMSTGAITTDVEVFRLQTLYPWHVMFTGFRILIESGGIFNGNYFASDANGQNAGYQWFSIVMYLAFLFAVIVVLLNLLIAQMSSTYDRIQEDVEGTFAIARARIISRLQKGKWLFCKESYRKRFFKKLVKTELPREELKQDEQEENADEKFALMEQKTDWLKETSAEITRRLQNREASAFIYKSEMEQKVDHLTKTTDEVTKRQLEREDTALQYKRLMEQKVDQMAAEFTKRQLEREDTALQYKSEMEQKVDQMTAELTKRQLEREHTALQYKRLLEQKVDHLAKMTDELTKRQLEREDTTLQYMRLIEQKVDRLTEMTAELTRRLQGREGRVPFRGTQ